MVADIMIKEILDKRKARDLCTQEMAKRYKEDWKKGKKYLEFKKIEYEILITFTDNFCTSGK
jgi:hypothetical protein